MDALEDDYACGLDLGTTFSCIGVYKNGGVEIIPNRNGDKITPSIVTILDENNILKGEEAMENLVKNYDSSIYAIKRFIGRKYNEKVQEEIKIEKFPFNITENSETNHMVVEIVKNGKIIQFNLEEISSFIIRKMIDNAEDYIKRKINKLVITVPANFNDSQRTSTKQAAELAGVEVLRIINEPTAAALAYGLQEKDNGGKILVFDLGGGTFDVTILEIAKNKNDKEEQIFEVLSTSGDKFLGGEDFDNKLVEYVLDKFCEANMESKEEIRKNKKAIKKLKISCEGVKKTLSYSSETTLCINHFYNDKDIYLKISQAIFEFICEDLFQKLYKPLDDALIDAKLTKNEIKQVILVGGSTRIPIIKYKLMEYFPEATINDSINPDETVAYGATLMAAKILVKKDKFVSKFNLMDITPFSLGTNIMNNSKEKELQKEGDLMSVIIKRGTKIPYTNTENYFTVRDNQTAVSLNIYEGEKKYVKYNHLLKEAKLDGLTKLPAGKVKVSVKFFIDVNGILNVTGKEEDQNDNKDNKIEIQIKNDGIQLKKDEMEKLKKKNEKYLKNININTPSEYFNLKESLKEYQDAYKESQDDEERFNILMGCNALLEEFINNFNKDFDNETVIEKFYIYIKELFISYVKVFKIEGKLDKGSQINIINNIKEYTKFFIILSSGYLSDLLEVLKDLPKKIFYEIIVSIMELFNEYGKNCLKGKKKFSKYNSLIYFEKSNNLFKKYINNLSNLIKNGCDIKIHKNCKHQVDMSKNYIADINSNIILLCEDALKNLKLISTGSGWTKMQKNMTLNTDNSNDENEKYQIVLETYERMLPQYEGKGNKEEAIILANLFKINFKLLGYTNFRLYNKWGDRIAFIAKNLPEESKSEWYKEFCNIYKELKDKYSLVEEYMRENIKKKFKKDFDELDEKFAKKKNNIEFIEYILKKVPYKGSKEEVKNNSIDFKKDTQELLFHLCKKYHPNEYEYSDNDEESQKRFCLIEIIDSYLNKLYSNI